MCLINIYSFQTFNLTIKELFKNTPGPPRYLIPFHSQNMTAYFRQGNNGRLKKEALLMEIADALLAILPGILVNGHIIPYVDC